MSPSLKVRTRSDFDSVVTNVNTSRTSVYPHVTNLDYPRQRHCSSDANSARTNADDEWFEPRPSFRHRLAFELVSPLRIRMYLMIEIQVTASRLVVDAELRDFLGIFAHAKRISLTWGNV